MIELRSKVKDTTGAKVVDSYTSPHHGAEMAFTEVETVIKYVRLLHLFHGLLGIVHIEICIGSLK